MKSARNMSMLYSNIGSCMPLMNARGTNCEVLWHLANFVPRP